MDEFAKIFFTGENAEGYGKFCRNVRILSLVGAVFTLIGAVIAFFGNASLALQLPFCLLGVLFSFAANIVSLFKRRAFGVFFELQRAQNALERQGETRERNERLAVAYLKAHPAHGLSSEGIKAIFQGIAYVSLCVFAVLIGTKILQEAWMLAAVALFCLFLSVPVIWTTLRETKERAAFYALAGADIDAVKRENLGYPEKRIARDNETVTNFSSVPKPVLLFLKEDVEKEDFRRVSTKSAIASFAVGFFLGIALLLPILLAGVYEKLGPVLSWTIAGSALVLVFGALFAFVLPMEARKREIFRRNFEKLGNGEGDTLKRELQAAWIRSQKIGNGMFFVFLVGSIVLGIILGLMGHFMGEAGLIESIGSCVMVCLIPAALVSFVVWTVMYAVYRRKARPIEAKLAQINTEEPHEGR